MDARLIAGDCRDAMREMAARGETVHAVVCDPPYELGFMGKAWDRKGIAFQPETWRLCWEVLPPGGHLVAFGGTRTFHRMAVAIEDAGFEIRDTLMWLYGTGFPKSRDVSKAIDAEMGAERERVPPRSVIGHQRNIGNLRPYMLDPNHTTVSDVPASAAAAEWDGWGTALKPAWEPIILARKPLAGTVAQNVLAHRTGALNVDGCRVALPEGEKPFSYPNGAGGSDPNHMWRGRQKGDGAAAQEGSPLGRWPANVLHDGSDEVEAAFAAFGERPGQQGRARTDGAAQGNNVLGALRHITTVPEPRGDTGSASRFFYSAKATAADRVSGCAGCGWRTLGARPKQCPACGGKKWRGHPTVKPIALMRWLVRLVCPPGGVVLDPFAGSGTTGAAAIAEGMRAVLCEADAEYQDDIRHRLASTPVVPRDAQMAFAL